MGGHGVVLTLVRTAGPSLLVRTAGPSLLVRTADPSLLVRTADPTSRHCTAVAAGDQRSAGQVG
ncbi:MAG: hypothetical protein V3W34_13160 [Phycisphaerae bacterium]